MDFLTEKLNSILLDTDESNLDTRWLEAWNDLHCKYTQEGAVIRNNKMADWCELVLIKAKHEYYGSGDVIMSDSCYDNIEDRLRILRGDSKILIKVG